MEKYIPKAAVVAEIEKLKGKVSDGSSYFNGWQHALRMLELSLNTLEVKEVDLEEEIDKFYGMYRKDGQTFSLDDNKECVDWKVDCNPKFEKSFAKHFFELGTLSTITEEDCKLIWKIGDDIPQNMSEEEFFKELLKRYKTQKGE